MTCDGVRDDSFGHVAQLADVAGPEYGTSSSSAVSLNPGAIADAREQADVVIHQQRDVSGPLAHCAMWRWKTFRR